MVSFSVKSLSSSSSSLVCLIFFTETFFRGVLFCSEGSTSTSSSSRESLFGAFEPFFDDPFFCPLAEERVFDKLSLSLSLLLSLSFVLFGTNTCLSTEDLVVVCISAASLAPCDLLRLILRMWPPSSSSLGS
jgi:hypothetical protein